MTASWLLTEPASASKILIAFSHFTNLKFNYYTILMKLALQCEVGLDTLWGFIAWIRRQFPAGKWPDISISCDALPISVPKLMVDTGAHTRKDEMPCQFFEFNREWVHATIRLEPPWICEQTFKQWGVLDQSYRHIIGDHTFVFRVIVVLAQLPREKGVKFWSVLFLRMKVF